MLTGKFVRLFLNRVHSQQKISSSLVLVVLVTFSNLLPILGINSNTTMKTVEKALKDEDIYPQLINKLPTEILEISYGGRRIRFGELLKDCTFTKEQPSKLSWTTDRKELYVIIMTDPDGPTWNRPRQNEWHHWLVTNIHETDLEEGEVLSEYIGPFSGQGNRLHRYIFMAFQQPSVGDLAFTELNLDTRPVNRLRGYFSTQKFSNKYNLTLKAINYFKVNWGPEIPGVAEPKPQKPPKMDENVTMEDTFLTMIPFL